jgi:CTP synthase (UTP-ammonia lyase)
MAGPRVAVVGEWNPGYRSHVALHHAAACLPGGVTASWVATDVLAADPDRLAGFDGVWMAPGSPYRSLDGALLAIRHARERGVPLVGT